VDFNLVKKKMSTTMSMNGAPVLLAQTSLAQEKYNYNGEQKAVHNVIKNHPFTLRVGFSSDTSINFNIVNTEAILVYDQEGPEKEVDFVKAKPLEYFTHTNDKGDQLFVQIRIKVLSSQHEDMFFRVKLNNYSTTTKEFIPALTIYSQPIKVISKPDQIKKNVMEIFLMILNQDLNALEVKHQLLSIHLLLCNLY